jgi:DNA-binding NtrC family response regulator
MTGSRFPDARILLVDDETDALEAEAIALEVHGFGDVATCSDSRTVAGALAARPADLVLLDVTMPHLDGLEVLRGIRQQWPDTIVVMLTGVNDAATAVECLKAGAWDYVLKPIDQSRLLTTVSNALDRRAVASEAERLGASLLDGRLCDASVFADILTGDPRMLAIFRYVEAVAPTDLPVLITGETGVGKELIARAIHRSGGRRGEFVSVNSAGIDDTLFSDTLFGHVAGAFTGAQRDRRGLIERAAHGTLFLDEIGDMKPESQVKLLRLLQEHTYYRLGSEAECTTAARIVTATNRTLPDLRQDPTFRKDLFYRLKSHHIHVPPLRERRGDIQMLAQAFLVSGSAAQKKPVPAAPRELFTILGNHDYPGNVRELQGLIYDAVSRHEGGMLSCSSVKASIGFGEAESGPRHSPAGGDIVFPAHLPTADDAELALIAEAMRRTGGNRKLAAEMIGMARQTFRTKLAKIPGHDR